MTTSTTSNKGDFEYHHILELQLTAVNLEHPSLGLRGLFQSHKPLNPTYKLFAFRPSAADQETSSDAKSSYHIVFRSETIRDTHNPVWNKHELDLELLVSDSMSMAGFDMFTPVKIEVYDKNMDDGEEILIGECETTLFDLDGFNDAVMHGDAGGNSSFATCFSVKDSWGKPMGSLLPLHARIRKEQVPLPAGEIQVPLKTRKMRRMPMPTRKGWVEDDSVTVDSSTTVSTMASLQSETSNLRAENEHLKDRVALLEAGLTEQKAEAELAGSLAVSLEELRQELHSLKAAYKDLRAQQEQSVKRSSGKSRRVEKNEKEGGSRKKRDGSKCNKPKKINKGIPSPECQEVVAAARARSESWVSFEEAWDENAGTAPVEVETKKDNKVKAKKDTKQKGKDRVVQEIHEILAITMSKQQDKIPLVMEQFKGREKDFLKRLQRSQRKGIESAHHQK